MLTDTLRNGDAMAMESQWSTDQSGENEGEAIVQGKWNCNDVFANLK